MAPPFLRLGATTGAPRRPDLGREHARGADGLKRAMLARLTLCVFGLLALGIGAVAVVGVGPSDASGVGTRIAALAYVAVSACAIRIAIRAPAVQIERFLRANRRLSSGVALVCAGAALFGWEQLSMDAFPASLHAIARLVPILGILLLFFDMP